MTFPTENVAIFWDYENCAIPASLTGYEVAEAIRRIAREFGSVTLFKAYLEVSEQVLSPRSMSLRSELQASGVSLTDCPHNGRKDVADKMMLVDMLAYAIDHPPPTTFMLISGDRDFSYALSILRLRRYRVALVTPPNTHISLTAQASHHLHWASDVLDASTNPPVKPPKKGSLSPTRVLSPPRVNFSSATPLARRNTDASLSRDRTTPSSTIGLLAPPTSGFSTDPEQTLVMAENSRRREARGRFRSLGDRGQSGSAPSIAVDGPPQSPKSPKREAVTSFFGTPFRLPRTPPTRFETQSFSQLADRKGKSREPLAPPLQTPQAPRNGTAYARVRSPLAEAVNAPLPQSPVSDGYQESEAHSGSSSERPPSSELGGEYDNDIPWESANQSPSEPLSPRTDLGNSAHQFEDSSGNADSIMSTASGSGSPMQSSRMPDGTPKRVVPFRFKPLVLQLQDCRRDGSYIPSRSLLIERMQSRFQPVERIYQNAGVEGFDEYIELAEQEGFVTTGGGDGPVEAWIMLRQEWVGSMC